MSITTIARRFAFGMKQGAEKNNKDLWDNITNDTPIGTNWNYSIQGAAWNDVTFNPPYVIKPAYATNFGYYSNFQYFDTSKVSDFIDCQNLNGIFGNSKLIKLISSTESDGKGRIYFNKAGLAPNSSATGVLNSVSNLVDAGIIILNDTVGNRFLTSGFGNDPMLEEIRFDGGYICALPYSTSPTTTAFVSSTKLSHDSIVSIVNALSPTVTGQNVCFSETAVNKAFETSTDADDGSTSAEWNELISTKTNWTFTLR